MSQFSITKWERQILFRKYTSLGNNYYEADKKVKDFCDYLKALKEKLKRMKIPEEDINTRFKREFEKLCLRLDAGENYLTGLGKGNRRKRRIFR